MSDGNDTAGQGSSSPWGHLTSGDSAPPPSDPPAPESDAPEPASLASEDTATTAVAGAVGATTAETGAAELGSPGPEPTEPAAPATAPTEAPVSAASAAGTGVGAGMFDRKREPEYAAVAAGGAAKPPRSSKSGNAQPVNRKLLGLLAVVAVAGIGYVVSQLGGGGDDTAAATKPTTAVTKPSTGGTAVTGDTLVDSLPSGSNGTAATIPTESTTTVKAGTRPLSINPTVTAALTDTGVTVSGKVKDTATKNAVVSGLRLAFPRGSVINDTLTVSPSAVSFDPTRDPVLSSLTDPVMQGVSARGVTLSHGSGKVVVVISGAVPTELARQRIIGAVGAAAGGLDKIQSKLAVDASLPAASNDAVGASVQERLDKLLSGKVVEFATGSAALTPQWTATVDQVAQSMVGNNIKLQITGHTDSHGNAEANLVLSRERAESIKAALVAKGVSADRITTAGFGPDRPVAPNDTPEGRQRNRRIEFVVAAQ